MAASERSAEPEPAAAAALHPQTFKLRFAAQRVPGHSYVSAVRPLALPALVTDKRWARGASETAAGERDEASERALRRVEDMFARGPREKYARPQLSSHEYGWWAAPAQGAARGDRRLQHHLRDSPWLKTRMRVLAADAPAQAAPRKR